MHRVERREIGLAGDAKDALDPLGDELIDENLPAGAGLAERHGGRILKWRGRQSRAGCEKVDAGFSHNPAFSKNGERDAID